MKLTASRLKKLIREELSKMTVEENMLPEEELIYDKMKKALKEKPLTPEELSKKSGVSISDIETMLTDYPDTFEMDGDFIELTSQRHSREQAYD